MFAGKGGVGKTTMSVSLSVFLADLGKRVFLLSTDPSGSLGDIFGGEVQSSPVEVVKGLEVLELTRDMVIKRWREKFGDDIYSVVSSFIPVGREILDYLEGAPGIDEEFILDYLLGLLDSGNYDFIVWDTAPTSGTLSLLKLQLLFYSHLTEAQKLYMKLKGLFKGKDPTALISEWRRLTERIIEMLKCSVTSLVVLVPERLPTIQALRIREELENFGMKVSGFVINRVFGKQASECGNFLLSRLEVQRKWENFLRERAGLPVLRIEELPSPDLRIEDYKKIGGLLAEFLS